MAKAKHSTWHITNAKNGSEDGRDRPQSRWGKIKENKMLEKHKQHVWTTRYKGIERGQQQN